MTVIKRSTKPAATVMLVEDPRPSSNAIYILGDAHDHSTLTPIFAKSLTTRTDTLQNSHIGSHQTSITTTGVTAHQPHASLMLTKGSVSVQQGTDGDGETNLDLSWGSSLDPDYSPTGCHVLSDGSGNPSSTGVFLINYKIHSPGRGQNVVYTNIDTNKELYEDVIPLSVYGGTAATSNNYDHNVFVYPYVDPISKRLPAHHGRTGSTSGTYQGPGQSLRIGNIGPWPNSMGSIQYSSLNSFNWWSQLIGVSSNSGQPLFFIANIRSDHQQQILSYDIGTNSTSILYNFSSVRPAFEGSLGGNRAITSGIRSPIKLASSLFEDPNDSGLKGFYYPFFDTDMNFQPYYFQWDPITDEFIRNEDISVITEMGSSDFFETKNDFNNFTPGGHNTIINAVMRNPAAHAIFCETLLFTQNNVEKRYLTLGVLHGQYEAHDQNASGGHQEKRTFIVFEIDNSDPKKLIYHSKITMPTTPRNIIWLNDEKTLLGVFFFNSFRIYSFNPTVGWKEGQVIEKQFWSVGRDRSDRIWAVGLPEVSNAGDLHLITPALPVTIQITPEDTTYNYQGVTINTFVEVDAFDVKGDRIETDVTLTIDGSTITFDDNSKIKIITTSTTDSVNVPIKIINSGFSQIISSVTI